MMTPIGQPQEIRPAAAAMPSAITRSTAMGVAIVVMEVTRFVAPVSKGDAAWAKAISGVAKAAIRHNTANHARALPINIVRFIEVLSHKKCQWLQPVARMPEPLATERGR